MEPRRGNVRHTTVRPVGTSGAGARGRRIGAGAAATLAGAAVLAGLAGSPSGPGPSPAAAAELPAFTGCAELLGWYVDAALPHVGPWGLGPTWGALFLQGRTPLVDLDARATAEPAAGPGDAVSNGATGTNVQEPGVDEPDVAKTDGTIVAHLRGQRLVLTDVSGRPRARGELNLPRSLAGAELLWTGDRLVVVGRSGPRWGRPVPLGSDAAPGPGRLMSDLPVPWGGEAETRVLVVDVTDPDAPHLERDTTFTGTLLEARQHDDVVRLVLSTTTPAIDFVHPRRGRTAREATRENRRRVRQSRIEDWLPTATDDGAVSPLVACEAVRHPSVGPRGKASYGTVTVVGFTATEPGTRAAAAVTTSTQTVYSSADRLYLALPRRRGTAVHAFALDGLDTTYVASGRVAGTVVDRWSMDEYDGHLRVATALGPSSWNPRENAVVVLEERDGALLEVGRVAGLGVRERIQSVRWFDDVAVVVTFRQVDPLYTLDLSRPGSPRLVGELKVPGFSSYLHPLGDGLLLGLGQDAGPRGRTRGGQASVFDLSHLADPRRVSTLTTGRHSEFAAGWDPRSLTYLPGRRLALAVLEDWARGRRLVGLAVAADGGLSRTPHDVPLSRRGGAVRSLPLDDEGRVAVVTGGRVVVLDLTR